MTPQEATASFPQADIAKFRSITQDTLTLLDGDQAAATAKITDLETAWDDSQGTLKPLNEKAWTFLDSQIDAVLSAVRSPKPAKETERGALNALLISLTP